MERRVWIATAIAVGLAAAASVGALMVNLRVIDSAQDDPVGELNSNAVDSGIPVPGSIRNTPADTVNPDGDDLSPVAGGDGDDTATQPRDGSTRDEGIKGTVIQLHDGAFTLAGTYVGDAVVSLTPDTEFSSELRDDFTADDIAVGMYLKVHVWVGPGDTPTGPEGTWTADRIREATPDD